jgi:hypothetical protein
MTKYTLDQLHASETLPCTRCDGTGNSRSDASRRVRSVTAGDGSAARM